MGFLNLSSSIRYGPHGKRRKTKAFTKKSKRTKYNELIQSQQRIYDKVGGKVNDKERDEASGFAVPVQRIDDKVCDKEHDEA